MLRFVHNKYHRAIEALTVGLVSVTFCFGLMLVSSDCLSLGETPDVHAVQLFCEDHQYSAMASLLFNTPEEAIKNLFHENREEFLPTTLILFGTLYFFVRSRPTEKISNFRSSYDLFGLGGMLDVRYRCTQWTLRSLYSDWSGLGASHWGTSRKSVPGSGVG